MIARAEDVINFLFYDVDGFSIGIQLVPPLEVSTVFLVHRVITVGKAVIEGIFCFEIFNSVVGAQAGERPAHPGMLICLVFSRVARRAFRGIDIVG